MRRKTIVSLLLVAVGLAALLAPGCRHGGGSSDDTLPPPRTTATTAPATFDIPAVIDTAYVARVMQALDHVYGDAVRLLARTHQVNEDFLRYLVAIHNPRLFGLVQDLWVKIQARGFEGLATSPGDPRTRIDTLLRADRDCVLIQGDRDTSPLYVTDRPTDHDRYVALTPLRLDRNPGGTNPTPWTINFTGQRDDGSAPEDVCVAQ